MPVLPLKSTLLRKRAQQLAAVDGSTNINVENEEGDSISRPSSLIDHHSMVRPKYVRGSAPSEGELGFWVRIGVALSGAISGEGPICAPCRRRRRIVRENAKVRIPLSWLMSPFDRGEAASSKSSSGRNPFIGNVASLDFGSILRSQVLQDGEDRGDEKGKCVPEQDKASMNDGEVNGGGEMESEPVEVR